MKRSILLLGLFLVSQALYPQVWQWQNPLPQGHSLFSVHFPSNLTGYTVGDYGTIMKTVDGGMNCSIIIHPEPYLKYANAELCATQRINDCHTSLHSCKPLLMA